MAFGVMKLIGFDFVVVLNFILLIMFLLVLGFIEYLCE